MPTQAICIYYNELLSSIVTLLNINRKNEYLDKK